MRICPTPIDKLALFAFSLVQRKSVILHLPSVAATRCILSSEPSDCWVSVAELDVLTNDQLDGFPSLTIFDS